MTTSKRLNTILGVGSITGLQYDFRSRQNTDNMPHVLTNSSACRIEFPKSYDCDLI